VTMSDEHAEQVTIFAWAALLAGQYPALRWLHSTQNGLYTAMSQAKRAKAAGLIKGVPDLCLPVAAGGYHGLWIELKTATGRVSPEQREWLAGLTVQGYRAVVCRGAAAAITEIVDYLAGCKTETGR